MGIQNEELKNLQNKIIEAQFGFGIEWDLMLDIARYYKEQKARGRSSQVVAAELGLAEWQLITIDKTVAEGANSVAEGANGLETSNSEGNEQ